MCILDAFVIPMELSALTMLAILIRWSCFKISSPHPSFASFVRICITGGAASYDSANDYHSLVVDLNLVRLTLATLLMHAIALQVEHSVRPMLTYLVHWSWI